AVGHMGGLGHGTTGHGTLVDCGARAVLSGAPVFRVALSPDVVCDEVLKCVPLDPLSHQRSPVLCHLLARRRYRQRTLQRRGRCMTPPYVMERFMTGPESRPTTVT